MAYNKKIAIWLFVCCFMVAAMVAIGGVTRLTHSGLSMTSWKPITGWLPPMNQEQWTAEFDSYKKSPEYLKINYGMKLDEFKSIFWLEFVHRLLGRVTGIVFFVPLILFILFRQVDRYLAVRLLGIFALGGAQGVIGWYMVSSGLKDAPHVSQYWLAFHLCTAFLIYTFMFLLGLSQYYGGRPLYHNDKTVGKFARFISIMIFIQVFLGALVAGLHAGLIYNTFPLMEGKFIPDELFTMQPWWMNMFDNVKTVQFEHRMMAYVVSFAIFIFWIKTRHTAIYRAANVLLLAVFVQFGLGVLTLISVVPVYLASAHQVMALVLFTVSLYISYGTMQKSKKSVKK